VTVYFSYRHPAIVLNFPTVYFPTFSRAYGGFMNNLELELTEQDQISLMMAEPPPPPETGALAPTRSRNRMRSNSAKWNPEDDALLARLVQESEDWANITPHFPGRTSKQILAHWRKVADPEIVRGSWTCQEDQAIVAWVTANGPTKWASLAESLPGRIAKQCRERWCNHLDPNIKKEPWSRDEDQVIIQAIQQVGTKWAEISRLLPGRTDNAVKNRWNSTLKRKNVEELHLEGIQMEPNLAEALLKQHPALMGLQLGETGQILPGDQSFGLLTPVNLEQIQAMVAASGADTVVAALAQNLVSSGVDGLKEPGLPSDNREQNN
jgi:hypothetical protein